MPPRKYTNNSPAKRFFAIYSSLQLSVETFPTHNKVTQTATISHNPATRISMKVIAQQKKGTRQSPVTTTKN